jgi:hypothetical protein
MTIQPEFTVSTVIRLKRESAVMNTSRTLISVLFLLLLGFAGNAAAVVPQEPPESPKKIVIVNNSQKSAFFPMVAAPKRDLVPEPNPDLWMQAAFVLQSQVFPNFAQKNPYPPFPTTLVYRAYIDITNTDNTTGLQPGQSVTITVPFFTQLQDVTDNNIGVNTDQFIDWWNATRVYLFEGATALHAAQITDGSTVDKKPHTPTPVAPVGGTEVPTCVASGGATCTVTLLSYTIDPPFGIPFQLQEYTFASAVGPPLNGRPAKFQEDGKGLLFVNYNVSSLDSVYLPVAMGPLGNSDVPYVGSTQSVADFRNQLITFGGDNGNNWPIYVPVYFDELSKHPGLPNEPIFNAACSLDAFEEPNEAPPIPRYELPKLPGTFNMLVESFRDPPPIPPVLTSDPPDFSSFSTSKCNPSPPPPFTTPPGLGAVGQGVLKLWHDCTDTSNNPRPPGSTPFASMTCIRLREQFNFFQTNYISTCKKVPDFTSTIQAIYGFVPITFNGCTGGALRDTAGFKDAIGHYCDLQYNYLTVIPEAEAEIFNPYTRLIHNTLKSSAYAFSIDDKVSFKHVKGTGIILAIAGANGLENTNPSPLPDRNNFKDQCQEKPPKAEVRSGLTPFTLELEQPPVSVP